MKLPQVQYGAVEKITQGTGEIRAAGQEAIQNLALVNQAGEIFQKAYTAHVAADTRNKFVDARAEIALAKNQQTDDANRLIDPEELRAHGIEVEGDQPVKGSIYAAPLFEKKAQAIRDKIGETVPAMFREKYDAATEDLVAQSAQEVYNKAKSWQKDENTADFTANTQKLLLTGQWEAARNLTHQATQEGTLNEQQKVAALDHIAQTEALDPVMKAVRGDSQTAIEEERAKLVAEGYKGPLDAKTKQAAIGVLNTRQDQLEREFQKADGQTKTQLYGDMSIGVMYGQGDQRITPIQIERAYKFEQLSVEQRNDLTHQYWSRIAAEEKAHKASIDVQDAIKNGVRLSHTNKDHKKGVDNYSVELYGTSIDAQKGTPEQRRTFEVGNTVLAAKTGILSTQAQAYMVGMNRSPDPEKSVEAANFYAQVAENAPQALLDVPERDRVRMEVTAAMASSGMPAAQAVRLGQEAADRTPEQQDQLKSTYVEAVRANGTSNRSALDSVLSPWFGLNMPANNRIRAEYDTMVSTFFGQTGDLKLARDMAGTRILGSWGRSTINGTPQAMKFSPESVTGLKSDQLRKELDSQIAANTFKTLPTGEAGPMDPKNVIITSDNRTGKDHKYALQYVRPDGMIDNLYTPDGKRAYWNPMPERSAEAQAQIDKIDEKARARQAAFKESQIGD